MAQSMTEKPSPVNYSSCPEKFRKKRVIGLMVSTLLATSYFAGATSAEQSDINCQPGELTTVGYGDTLWEKAEEIQAEMAEPHSVDTGQIIVELREANNMESVELFAGQKLRTISCE